VFGFVAGALVALASRPFLDVRPPRPAVARGWRARY
jgi:hypothetical protein